MISEQLNLNTFSVHQIVTDTLHMRKVCAKLVVKNLTPEQKDIRTNVCVDLLERIANDQEFLNCVITGDESWIFEYDPETKRQSKEWHTAASPRPKKCRMSKSKIKTMLICFFDRMGIVHKEFVPPGQTVNQVFYKSVLERLRKRVIRVRPEIADKWMLHHDNAPCHTAISIREYLTSKRITVVPQPPYSPDLSPCDFFLFPTLKHVLKGRHFGTLENIQRTVTVGLNAITLADFQRCYREWERRLRRCIAAQGDYFEGDNIVV
jgi:transposase